MGLLTKIFGSSNGRSLKRIEPIVNKIESYDETMQKLSDEQLKAKTDEFKKRFKEDHQWGVTARSDHLIRSLRIHRHQGEGSLKLIGHTTKRHQQIAAGP